MDFSRRSLAGEHLDAPHHDPAVLTVTLRHLAGVNRWLGGTRVITTHLATCTPANGTLSVLDVGTGGCDIPNAIVAWGVRRKWQIDVCGVDRQEQIAGAAGERSRSHRSVRIVTADGMMLPFSDATFDVAMSSLTLHHLDDHDAGAFIAELCRVSRRAVIVNDLERHPVNYAGARALAATVWRRDPYTRHDGPISVLRSFRPAELLELGIAAGMRGARVHRHFPYRLALVGRPA